MDRYDQEIERLLPLLEMADNRLGHPLTEMWLYGEGHSPLFDAIGRMRTETYNSNGFSKSIPPCGCATQIKSSGCIAGASGMWKAETVELTLEIQQDPLIPASVFEVTTREQLERFAYYQRKADEVLHRTLPPLLPVKPPATV
jgi:hypothetical protein